MSSAWGDLVPLRSGTFKHVLKERMVTVGRAPGSVILIEDGEVSSTHCVLSYRQSQSSGRLEPIILDCSTNGTFLNGKLIGKGKRKLLRHGDELDILSGGRLSFKFLSHLDSFVPPPEPSAPLRLPDSAAAPVQKTLVSTTKDAKATSTSSIFSASFFSPPSHAASPQQQQQQQQQQQPHSVDIAATNNRALSPADAVESLASPDGDALKTLHGVLSGCADGWLREFASLEGVEALFGVLGQFNAKGNRALQSDERAACLAAKSIRVALNESFVLERLLDDEATAGVHLSTLVEAAERSFAPSKLRVLACNMLSAIAVFSDLGHAAVLSAFDMLAARNRSSERFKSLVASLAIDRSCQIKAGILSLINSIVSFPDQLAERCALRAEFEAQHLLGFLELLRRDEDAEIAEQIAHFEKDRAEDTPVAPAPVWQPASTPTEQPRYLPAPTPTMHATAAPVAAPHDQSSAVAVVQLQQQLDAVRQQHDELLQQRRRLEGLLESAAQKQENDALIISHLFAKVQALETATVMQPVPASAPVAMPPPAAAPPPPPPPPPPPQTSTSSPSAEEKVYSLRSPGALPSVPMKKFFWSKIAADQKPEHSVWSATSAWDRVPVDYQQLEQRFCAPSSSSSLSSSSSSSASPPATTTSSKITALLNPKRANNVGIVLRQLGVGPARAAQAILRADVSVLQLESLQTLAKCLPLPEEIEVLQSIANEPGFDSAALPPAEQFWCLAASIPQLSGRVDAMLSLLQMPDVCQDIGLGCNLLLAAEAKLVGSRQLPALLSVVLAVGNFCNFDAKAPGRGATDAFKLDFLAKLPNTRAKDGTNVCHYICEHIARHNAGLLTQLNDELSGIDAAARLSAKGLVAQYGRCIDELKKVSALLEALPPTRSDPFATLITPLYMTLSESLTRLQSKMVELEERMARLGAYFGLAPTDQQVDSIFSVVAEFVANLNKAEKDLARREVVARARAHAPPSSAPSSLQATPPRRENVLDSAYSRVRVGTIRKNLAAELKASLAAPALRAKPDEPVLSPPRKIAAESQLSKSQSRDGGSTDSVQKRTKLISRPRRGQDQQI